MTDYEEWVTRRRQRATIREIAMRPVLRRWPTVLKEDGAYEMGAGWIPLLERAAERVTTYSLEWGAQIVGGKQKFGFFKLDVDYVYSEHPSVIGSRSEIKRLREEIRLTSLSICEICGQSGRLRQVVSAQTLCEEHAAEMGMALPDDGRIADPLDEMPPDRLSACVGDYLRTHAGQLDEVAAEAHLRAFAATLEYLSPDERQDAVREGMAMMREGMRLGI